MKKVLRVVLLVVATGLFLGVAGFFIWAATPSQPQAAALAALQSDSAVSVTDHGAYLLFSPSACKIQRPKADQRPPLDAKPSAGFIFYPGGRVDYRAYAPVLRKIAERGYLVALVPVPLNLALFNPEAGAAVLSDFPEITTWAAGGHSLGAVAAGFFAEKHPEIRGLVFWAYLPEKIQGKIPVLSIYGTQDGFLPESQGQVSGVQVVPILGGNHAQFGDYGPQSGDHPAAISPEEQWQQTSEATVAFLKTLIP